MVQDEWARLYSALNYQPRPNVNFFGRALALSGPANLSDVPVMDVKATQARYWRAVVYDRYTGLGWVNTDEETVFLGAHKSAEPQAAYLMRKEITQTIQVRREGVSLLSAAPQPVRVNRATRVELSYLPTFRGQEPPFSAEVSMLYSQVPLRNGESYQVVSSVSEAPVEQLRRAGEEYPPELLERYTQLPPDLPERVRQLAHELTKGQTNVYDKVAALESYLRTIPYNLLIKPPPEGWDGVDYFLFENRQGYCDYYASSLAVMARALGIPARVVAGYARGEYNPQTGSFLVRENNAHSWVEVWFPGYGWIEFEPTASEPPIVRPTPMPGPVIGGPASALSGERPYRRLREPDEGAEDKIGPGEEASKGLSSKTRLLIVLGSGLSWILLLGLAVWLSRQRRTSQNNRIQRFYGRMMAFAWQMNLPLSPSHTPFEQARLLAQSLPAGQEQVHILTELYVRERWGGAGAVDSADQERAAEAWQVLRSILWRQWLQYRLKLKRFPLTGARSQV